MSPQPYVVKVVANQEKVVAEMMYKEAVRRIRNNEEQNDIYSIFYAPELKGYVLVESDNPGTVDDLARNIPKTKGLLLRKKGDLQTAGTVPLDDLNNILKPTPVVEKVNRGDLVELISGPFKGEKARVAKISTTKDEITVELIEAAVSIPVIVKGYDLRIVVKTEEEE